MAIDNAELLPQLLDLFTEAREYIAVVIKNLTVLFQVHGKQNSFSRIITAGMYACFYKLYNVGHAYWGT